MQHKAARTALLLHRDYNAMVIERVGHIESRWAKRQGGQPESACEDALMRLGLLQMALRRRLLDEARPFLLSRKDPAGRKVDFSHLDALEEELWRAS